MSAEEFGGLGFAPGVVRGVRSFTVDKYGRLTGIHYQQVWLPGENKAECRKGEPSLGVMASSWASLALGGILPSTQYSISYSDTLTKRGRGKSQITATPKRIPVPVEEPQHSFADCSCGFYGYFDGSDDYHDKGRVTAVVEAYGEIVIGTRGFRAMKARIVALRVKPDHDGLAIHTARKVSTAYNGIPLFDDFDQMVAAFPPDVSLAPSPANDPDFWTRS